MDYSQQAAEWASQHKCPGCGGEMAYDGTNDCLRCKQCGNTVAVDASLGEVFEYAYSHPETAFNLQWGQQKVSLRCKNCGASGEYDVLAAADFCPFCGGSVVLCGEDPPDGVIPFKMEEEDIFSHLRNWFKTKKMAPGKFKKLARIANPRASFVPFWTYDAHVETSYTAEVGEDETRTYTDSDGDLHTETVTHWHWVSGDYAMDFDNLPINASNRPDFSNTDGDTFRQEELLPYSSEVLAGKFAEKPNFDRGEGWQRGQRVMKSRLESAIESSLLGRWDHVRSVNTDPVYSHVRYKSIYLPIWLCDYEYRGKRYTCTINAQTGKVIGKAPVSPFKVAAIVVAVLAAVALIIYFVNK